MSNPASSAKPVSGLFCVTQGGHKYQATSRRSKEARESSVQGRHGSDGESDATDVESEDGRRRRMLTCLAGEVSIEQDRPDLGGMDTQPRCSNDPVKASATMKNLIVRRDIITATDRAIGEMVQNQIKSRLPGSEVVLLTECQSEFAKRV